MRRWRPMCCLAASSTFLAVIAVQNETDFFPSGTREFAGVPDTSSLQRTPPPSLPSHVILMTPSPPSDTSHKSANISRDKNIIRWRTEVSHTLEIIPLKSSSAVAFRLSTEHHNPKRDFVLVVGAALIATKLARKFGQHYYSQRCTESFNPFWLGQLRKLNVLGRSLK